MKIILLWPTVRPKIMIKTYNEWIKLSSGDIFIETTIAVNTKEQYEQLKNNFEKIYIVGEERKGPVFPTFILAKKIKANLQDIIILVSDDFFPFKNWDKWLKKVFSDFDGAIMVNDGYQREGCITLPIMTYNCLLKLNKIIYHPSYIWQFSDKELYNNLVSLKLLKNYRKEGYPIFEHRHWANKKRKFDKYDEIGRNNGGKDKKNYDKRIKLSIEKRLIIDQKYIDCLKNINIKQ